MDIEELRSLDLATTTQIYQRAPELAELALSLDDEIKRLNAQLTRHAEQVRAARNGLREVIDTNAGLDTIIAKFVRAGAALANAYKTQVPFDRQSAEVLEALTEAFEAAEAAARRD